MYFKVSIDPRSTKMPGTVKFNTEEQLMVFINEYCVEYYPEFIYTDREELFDKLCSIQKIKDSKFKIIEVELVQK